MHVEEDLETTEGVRDPRLSTSLEEDVSTYGQSHCVGSSVQKNGRASGVWSEEEEDSLVSQETVTVARHLLCGSRTRNVM
jgi:hypothetical protein